MVGGGPQVLEQQPQSLPQSLSAAEEEAVKRNTDCVYFLASPLTCKKGTECEYRHSEYARVNPRDCWFWLNGNCLNPKCSFRHPPLDGLVGTPHSANPGSQIPSQTSVIPSAPVNSSNQAVSCIFFQKGLCLKGDRCAFLHGPSLQTSKVPQTTANAQASGLPSVKKVSGGSQRNSQEQKIISQADFSKSIGGASAKHIMKDETVPSKFGNNEKSGLPAEVADGGSRFKATNLHPILNESSLSRCNRLQQSNVIDDHGLQNGKDADEFLKESSPGFDVLVDDELRGSGYYGSEEQYGRARGHEGTNMISMNEYDIGHSADYKIMSDVDHDVYNDVTDYDYDSRQGQYGWEPRRSSSDKLTLGSTQMERRLLPKSNSPEHVQNVDLRHRLNNKQRRGNGLRSVINNDNAASHPEERNYRSSGRDSHPSQESSMSNRLRGRIKLPRIPSPVRNSSARPERDSDRGRPWGRLSPGRSQSLSHQGSTRDEMKGRLEEDYNNERRNFNGPSSRRDRMDGPSNFAPPKRLAELKGEKHVVSREQQTLGKRKSFDNEQSVGELSFEGPKPLSEILKKKRQVKDAVDMPRNNAERESSVRSIERSTTLLKQEANILEGTKSASAETFGQEKENTDVSHRHSSEPKHSTDDHEIEAYDETLEEEHEYEGDDQRDGEYEYEQVDDGEYNYEEGETDNLDPEEEFMDEEDGDDFAKKIGVLS